MDVDAGTFENVQVEKRHPRLEDFSATLKILVKNKVAMAGLIISVVYFSIAILDWTYPNYLGINAGTGSLSDALLAFHRVSSFQGVQYIVGLNITTPPWMGAGSTGITLVPPTLNGGPVNTPAWWWYLGGTTYNLPIFPVMLASLKVDLTDTLLIVIVGALIGTVVGTISGFYGGVVDEALMRLVDIFFSVPFLVLAIAIVYALGARLEWVIVALIIIWWPTYARLTRGQALSVKSNKYVEAASASGSSKMRTVFSHILPNVLAPVFIQISLDLGTVIQIFATLDFLGFHFTSFTLPELGNMLNWGNLPQYIFNTPINWWPILIPGIFLVIFTVAVNLFGDGLRDVLDPKLRR